MKHYFQYMCSTAGRWVRSLIGIAMMGWGYSNYQYPLNAVLMIVGAVVTIAALANVSLFAPLFGYPVCGNDMTRKYGEINGVPGEDHFGERTSTEYKPKPHG